jgi:HSP20 family protein
MIDPSREFEDIYDRMGQLITMAFGDLPAGQVLNAPWRPLANISETDDGYQVEVELPGVNKDQLNVELNDRELAITGEVAEPKQEDGRRRRRSTRRTGRFEFRASLPGDINPEGVSATLSDGVLTVKIPKSEAARPHRVEVTG